jgi:lysozyme
MRSYVFIILTTFLLCFFLLEQAWERGLVFPLGALSFAHVGLDVSHHQGEIDWAKVSGHKPKIDFVYIKATEGEDHKDTRFAENWQKAQQAGIKVGAYHFFTLCKPGDLQFQNFLDSVPVLVDAMPPAIDLEFGGNCSNRPDRDDLLADVLVFARQAEKYYGKKPVLYVTKGFYRRYLRGSELGFPFWVRDLIWQPSIPTHQGWDLWQFTSRARVSGINTPVDLNAAKKLL